jgi:hypothetical protein
MEQEHAANILDQEALGFVILRHARVAVPDHLIGFTHQIVEVGIAPGVTSGGLPPRACWPGLGYTIRHGQVHVVDLRRIM